ncbi:MAG: hypothetical protein KBC12_01315 [Candidatus Pacebacteria bacterium]|nr:hypothetical protein [Candidatus Paceibacterota bacterium]MBP9851448.1 hypothetical protein [Candidatus Paceibacterota bacterium]
MKQLQNKKNNFFIKAYISALMLVPVSLYAKTFKEVVDIATGDLATVIAELIFAVAFLFFFWGVVQYVLNPTQEAKDKSKGYMIWGIIGLAVMFSVYGLIRLVTSVVF